jgi:hypothetical protein
MNKIIYVNNKNMKKIKIRIHQDLKINPIKLKIMNLYIIIQFLYSFILLIQFNMTIFRNQ